MITLPNVIAAARRQQLSDTPDLHGQLRGATDAVHQRLHRHPGFAAVQDETIDRAQYTALLKRLLGFHRPFEIAAGLAPLRSHRLADDLAVLQGAGATLENLPLCRDIPPLHGPEDKLGALYVVEGSALGGRGLARHLDALLGVGAPDGRRFFSGEGTGTGVAWRAYLARLAGVSPDPAVRRRVIGAATATFAAFENWLRDWNEVR